MDFAAAVSLTELRNEVRRPEKKVRLPETNGNEITSKITTPTEGTSTSTSTPASEDKSSTTSPTTPKDIKKKLPPKVPGESELRPAPYFHYTDRSQETDDDPLTPLTPPGRVPNFPATMHAILCDPALKDVIAWQPHGRSWRIINPRELEIRVLPKYFEHNKFSSFIRQTNGWGFRRLTKGQDRHSYYNENFLRGLPHLCKKMKRVGSASKVTHDSSCEPDLYEIDRLHPLPKSSDFVDESIKFQVSKGPRARMPVAYGVFDATKPGTSINPTIESLFKRKTIDPSQQVNNSPAVQGMNGVDHTKRKQLKALTDQSQTNMPQQPANSTSNSLSSSLREISSMHLQAAMRAQMLSEYYNNTNSPLQQTTTPMAPNVPNHSNYMPPMNQIPNVYNPTMVNPPSFDPNDTAKIREFFRNLIEKNHTSHP